MEVAIMAEEGTAPRVRPPRMRILSKPMSNDAIILCPYCGSRQAFGTACEACGGRFDAWSLSATQNDMGAWFVRDSKRPHFVGCSYDTLVAAIRAGEIGRDSIVRGPSTRQFWTVARRAAGLAHLFGRCHGCQGPVTQEKPECAACGTAPLDWQDRNYFGLPPIETVAPPTAALEPQALVATAFVREGSVYFVRTSPIPAPTAAIVRIAPPAALVAAEPTPAPPPEPTPEPASAAIVPAPPPPPAPLAQPVDAQPPRIGLSPLDRSLADRVRRLERTNQILLLATAFAAMLALVLGGAYIVQRDARVKELAEAREEAIREVRADFERAQPVTKSKAVDLPSEPDSPPTQVVAPPVPATRR